MATPTRPVTARSPRVKPSPGDGAVIRAGHLAKRFGEVLAVDDLSFALSRGTVTGFLGPNGARQDDDAADAALLPRWAGAISSSVVVVAVLLGPLFGAATFQLPQSAQDLSPFTHIPKAPAAEITATPVLSLLAVAAVLTVAGLVAFRRRNLALPT